MRAIASIVEKKTTAINLNGAKMASDTKRIPAPESIPYHLTARQKTQTYQEKLTTTLQNGQRQDRRKFEEARKICTIESGSNSEYSQ